MKTATYLCHTNYEVIQPGFSPDGNAQFIPKKKTGKHVLEMNDSEYDRRSENSRIPFHCSHCNGRHDILFSEFKDLLN